MRTHKKLPDIPKAVDSAVKFTGTVFASLSEKKKRDTYQSFEQLFAITEMPERYRTLVLSSMEAMSRSKDPFHTETHPGRMAHDLLKFIRTDPNLLHIMDMQSLVIAI